MYFSKYNFLKESESAQKLFSNLLHKNSPFWIPALLNIAGLLYKKNYLQEWMWGWFRKMRSLGMSKYSRIIQVRDFKHRPSVFSIGILEGFLDNSVWKYEASKKSECQVTGAILEEFHCHLLFYFDFLRKPDNILSGNKYVAFILSCKYTWQRNSSIYNFSWIIQRQFKNHSRIVEDFHTQKGIEIHASLRWIQTL